MRRRIVFVFTVAAFCFFSVIFRLGWLQFVKGNELQSMSESLRIRETPVAANRGDILDRNGNKLAVSISADSVAVSPPEISAEKEEEIAKFLSETLELDYDTVYKKVTSGRSFEWIKRKVSFDVSEKIKEKDFKGVSIVQETQRFYPEGQLAANVLGFAGVDNQGLDGIEVAMDDVLKGKDGSTVAEYDAKSREIPQAVHRYNSPVDGYNVSLTIDETIQYFCERELDALMAQENKPKGVTAVVMRPKTGEILAMASRPTYDPNNYGQYETTDYRNKAVSDSYEPGSTFKILVSAAALEEGVVTPEERFYDPGYIKVGSNRIRCWRHYRPHGSQSFTEVVQNSCNPGFVEIGLRLEKKSEGLLYKYLKAFGIGSATGISLPGEASGLMTKQEDLRDINIATISIGQGIAVTPLQLVTAVSAVANGGVLMEPQIVREVTDKDGNVITPFTPKEVRRVVSKQTADTMCQILETVVSQGTGRKGYVEGYRVGGKTGTAQKAGKGGYMDGKYVASFIGLAPVNDPELVILVAVDEPSGGAYQGGQVAGPIFQKIMEDSLHYLGVPSQQNENNNLNSKDNSKDDVAKQVIVPDVVNLPQEEAEKVLKIAGLKTSTEGSGAVVVKQTPAGFSKVDQGTKVVLRLGNAVEGQEGFVTIPDLTGKRLHDAADLLAAMGLTMQSEGSGLATEQNPIPGTKVKSGTSVKIIFTEESEDVAAVGP